MPDLSIKDVIAFVEQHPYSEWDERSGKGFRILATELAIKFGSPQDMEDAFSRHCDWISKGSGFASAFGYVNCALMLAPHVSRARQEHLFALLIADGLKNHVVYLAHDIMKRKLSADEVEKLAVEYCQGCVFSTDTEEWLLAMAREDAGYECEQTVQRLLEQKRKKDESDADSY